MFRNCELHKDDLRDNPMNHFWDDLKSIFEIISEIVFLHPNGSSQTQFFATLRWSHRWSMGWSIQTIADIISNMLLRSSQRWFIGLSLSSSWILPWTHLSNPLCHIVVKVTHFEWNTICWCPTQLLCKSEIWETIQKFNMIV